MRSHNWGFRGKPDLPKPNEIGNCETPSSLLKLHK